MSEPVWLDFKEVVAIHGEILADSGGATGILNQGMLESTLNKPKNLYYYSDSQASLYELAAAIGYGLIKNHCFVDGNKRIALIAVYTFLALNAIELNASEEDAATFFIELAATTAQQEESTKKMVNWLEKNCNSIDTL